jgi:hypothetical protein
LNPTATFTNESDGYIDSLYATAIKITARISLGLWMSSTMAVLEDWLPLLLKLKLLWRTCSLRKSSKIEYVPFYFYKEKDELSIIPTVDFQLSQYLLPLIT